MAVYVVGAELGGSSVAFRAEGYAGGFVNCFVKAKDIRNALDMAEGALHEDGYEIVLLERASIYEAGEWDHDAEIESLCKLAESSEQVVYGPFQVFGN